MDMSSIEGQLSSLTSAVESLQKQQNTSSNQNTTPALNQPELEFCEQALPNHGTKHVEFIREDFLTEEEASTIKAVLENETFSKEGKRLVKQYGATYKYMGSRGTQASQATEPLNKLLVKLRYAAS